MKIRTSEVFRSFQGEGLHTGALSIWVRVFGCNLECSGFSQTDPTDSSTYKLPVQTIDVSSIKRMEDLPVLEYGCDSGYSWNQRFKHLATDYTEVSLAARIVELLPTKNKTWRHPATGNFYDLCFTGGEPMMQQKQLVSVMKQMKFDDKSETNKPQQVQIETNGTKPLTEDFKNYVRALTESGVNVSFNISPKLFAVSGEKSDNAWKPEVIASYINLNSGRSSLKFVVSTHKDCWTELDAKTAELKALGVNVPIFVMPVGGTKEQQEDSTVVSTIANEAIERGYAISGRVHATIFGNAMAT